MSNWTEYDAVNILALPLWRWANREHYRLVSGGFDGDIRTQVYSNGTDHGFATEEAEYVLDVGPMLRLVLFEGVRSLMADNDLRLMAYVGAAAAGDREQMVQLEREVTAAGDET